MDIPDLTIEKFHIMEDIGPSYKFAFNQAYVGMIIWARKVILNFMTETEVLPPITKKSVTSALSLDSPFLDSLIFDPAVLRHLNSIVIWQ